MEDMAGKPWNSRGLREKRVADEKDNERVWAGLADILIEIKTVFRLGFFFWALRLRS